MKKITTKERIKTAARRLFAERGVDGVTVREIVSASEQKNAGSLHYYFGTKDALIRELIVDTAQLIDDRRNEQLDNLEARGGPESLKQVLEVLVFPSTNLAETSGEEDTYLRFISLLALQNRTMLDEVLEAGLNRGYQRCLAHIRRLSPDIAATILEQRLVFMSISLRAVMAAREAGLERKPKTHEFWRSPHTLSNLLLSLEGMLTAPTVNLPPQRK